MDGGSRHLEVEPGPQRRRAAVAAVPVAHHDPVEPPVAAEDVAQQPFVLGAERPAEPVVGGHHAPHAGALHRGFERDEVQLTQRFLVGLDRYGHPLELGVVGDEVLDARGDSASLQTLDVADRQFRREQRILAEALEVATADRRPGEVDRWPEQDVDTAGDALPGEGATDLGNELGIERCPERHTARERE